MSSPFIRIPSDHSPFLRISDQTYFYGHLMAFRHELVIALEKTEKPQILISGESTPEHIMLIASCWLNSIPFYIIPPDLNFDDIPRLDHITHFYDNGQSQNLSLDYLEKLSISLSDKVDTNFELPLHDNDDIFATLLTSGTTGKPDPIPLRRRQILHAISSSLFNFYPQPQSYWLLNLPIYHMGGLNVIMRSLLLGSAIHLAESSKVEHILKEIQSYSDIQFLSLVPTQLRRLLDLGLDQFTSQLNGILLGGGPANQETITEAKSLSLKVSASYGMTETCGQIAAQNLQKSTTPDGSVGKIMGSNEARIVDDNGKICKPGKSGLLELKGPQIPNKEDFPDKFSDDGWFQTGDFAHFDAKGYLYIESRRIDLIVSGGKNIRPFEIEQALEKHPDIEESAVIAEPDSEWGQIAVAVLVLKKNKKVPESEIKTFLSKDLPNWKIPKKWIIREKPLPRTALGKVQKNLI